ncbi:MAG: SRPBCC family protein [Pseudomonadota bacterium]
MKHSTSQGTAHALQKFGMGTVRDFRDITPGAFVNLNRNNRTGHAVIFLGYLDARGKPVARYDDAVAGFRYFSSQGNETSGGFGYRHAFFSDVPCPAPSAHFKRDCGVIRSFDPLFLNAGIMWHPADWIAEKALDQLSKEAYHLKHSKTDMLKEGEFDSTFFSGETTDNQGGASARSGRPVPRPGRQCPFIPLPCHANLAPHHYRGDNMIKKIGIGLLAIIAIICGLAMTKPDSYTVTRSITIKAPPEKIIGLVSDFHQWPTWSPWEKLDPNMVRTHSGAASGKGAVYHWKGNDDVGEGRMEITDVAMPGKVLIKLDFIDPFESNNTTEFTFVPQGETTTVTWTMTGPMQFMTKLMSVFSSMDAMIGKDFEKGLAQMKTAAEK